MSTMSTHRTPNVWVVRYRGGWVAKLENNTQLWLGASQASVIAFARSIAKRMGVRMVIQRRNGRIRRDEAPRGQMTIWYRRSAWISFKSTTDGLIYAVVTGLVFVWCWPR